MPLLHAIRDQEILLAKRGQQEHRARAKAPQEHCEILADCPQCINAPGADEKRSSQTPRTSSSMQIVIDGCECRSSVLLWNTTTMHDLANTALIVQHCNYRKHCVCVCVWVSYGQPSQCMVSQTLNGPCITAWCVELITNQA